MSQGGRNLQDIYDAGVKRFEEAERDIKTGMENHTRVSTELCEKRESSVMQRMEASLTDQEKEVEAYTQQAAGSIASIVKAELEENERFLSSLKDGLELSHRCLIQDINEFRDFLTQFSENQLSQHSELLKRDSQRLVTELKGHRAERASALRSASSEAQFKYGDEIALAISETLKQYSRSPADLYDIVASGVSEMEASSLNAKQSLTAKHDEALDKLKQIDSELSQKLENVSKQCLVDLQNTHTKTEGILKDFYEKVLSEAMTSQASLATSLGADYEKGLEFSRDELSNSLLDLQTVTTITLEDVKQKIAEADFAIREKAGTLADGFEQSLSDRMNEVRQQQESLAEDRRNLMEKIKNDLADVAQEYEKRLSALSQQCLEKLSSICVDAEIAITTTHDNCAAEFRSVAQAQQNNIEQKTKNMLERIDNITNSAVNNIKAAAGDGGLS